ncbi:MAG: hypothetical protein V1913_11195 [Fibrobacterota bacterium]
MTPGTGTLKFTAASGTQVFTPKAATTHPAIVHDSAGTLQLSTNALSCNSFTQNRGKLDFNGKNLTTVSLGNFTVNNGDSGTFLNLSGCTLTVAGNAAFNGQVTNYLNMDFPSDWYVNATGTLTAQRASLAHSRAIGSVGSASDCRDRLNNFNWNFALTTIDSMFVKSIDLMPAWKIAERQASLSALRLIFRHPNTDSDTQKVTSLSFTMTPTNPSTVIARKALRRIGAGSDFFSSTTIEGANPMVFDLSSSPITVRAGQSDTFDVMFDVIAAPATSVKFSLAATSDIVARNYYSNDSVSVKGDGVAFPLASGTGTVDNTTNTPSAKFTDGVITDWTVVAERIDTKTADEFYVTWDNVNIYFTWNGRDLSSAGDLFIYLNTATGGAGTTWNYASYGTHNFPSGFMGANYCLYYDNSGAYGLRNGAAAYGALTFNGTASASGSVTELTIPRSDLGNPDTIRIIPIVQNETAGDIVVALPCDNVGPRVKNPTGAPSQTFRSWMRAATDVEGQTPVQIIKFDSIGVDSMLVKSVDLMPSWKIAERQTSLSALRLIFTHPNTDADTHQVTRLSFTMAPTNPSTVIARKALRRIGAGSDLFTSTTIEGANPMVFDLSSSPIQVRAGQSDTIDVMFDAATVPSVDTVKFTLAAASAITVSNVWSGDSVAVRGNGVSFPLASTAGSLDNTTNAPSAKLIDGNVADWTAVAERIDTRTTDGFYMTWDHDNFYFGWSGRDLSNAGDLFIYISTGTGGDSMTYDYGSYGRHRLPVNFRNANYLVYYVDGTTQGLRDGANGYSALTFNGTMSSTASFTEIKVPRADLGSPDSIRVVPFIQKEASGEVLASVPYAGVSEFVHNPVGLVSQVFLSWMNAGSQVIDQTPVQIAMFDSSPNLIKPTWVYPLGSTNYAANMSFGNSAVYVAQGGTTKKMIKLNNIITGPANLVWSTATYSGTPTAAAAVYDAGFPVGVTKSVLFFCEGNNLHIGVDEAGSFDEVAWSPVNIGSLCGAPKRSTPPDNANGFYAYIAAADGKVHKIELRTGTEVQTSSALNVNPLAGLSVTATMIFAGCTNGNLKKFNTSLVEQNNAALGSSIDFRINYISGFTGRVYAAPTGNFLYALNASLSQQWSKNLGAPVTASPYIPSGTTPFRLYTPNGKGISFVRDDTASATISWTYNAIDTVRTDPNALGNGVYFSAKDKKNYAINITTGAIISGWPTAVLDGENLSMVIVDATTNSLLYGGGDGKVYRYPKQ